MNRLRVPHTLSLADAAAMVPRQLADLDAPKVPKTYLGRSSAEMRAEHQVWLDDVPTRATCLHCPGWSSEGSALETREASRAHRASAHPGTPKPRRGRAELKAAHIAAAAKLAERAVVREGEPQARQATPGDGVPGLGDGASPSPSQTTCNPYHLEPLGRSFRWTREASILAVQGYAEAVGSPPGQNASRGEPVGTLPSLTAARRLFGGWAALVEAAGFARPACGGTRIAGAA